MKAVIFEDQTRSVTQNEDQREKADNTQGSTGHETCVILEICDIPGYRLSTGVPDPRALDQHWSVAC